MYTSLFCENAVVINHQLQQSVPIKTQPTSNPIHQPPPYIIFLLYLCIDGFAVPHPVYSLI